MTKKNSPELASQEILQLARSQLLVNFRFLDRALFTLDLKESSDVSFISDGYSIYYDPWFIINLYKKDENIIARNYLHLILHLIFRHSYVGKDIDQKRWNLACDMAVENIINEMNKPFLKCNRQNNQSFLEEIKNDEQILSAEVIYDILEKNYDETKLDEEYFNYWGDSHAIWYDDENAKYSKDLEVKVVWEDISKRMQVELEMMEKDDKSLLFRQLKNINKAKKDYDEFLRKFQMNSEVLKISEEEFDNNYYAYGLNLYGNMPIIEPLEYSEGYKIKEFVIAIDTSGSINKEVCEKFISHTYKLLSNRDSFDEKTCIHIIQCDDRIREDKVIKTKEEMEDYIDHIEIKGLGQTDFRPVFNYVEELKKKGELRNLKGLLYFTDGEGIFPKERPNYDVVFIIHQSKIYDSIKVPLWSMKIELDEEDITSGKF